MISGKDVSEWDARLGRIDGDPNHCEELVKANVDVERVGENWPFGVAQLIMEHEKKHVRLLHRKDLHPLMDRYAARYFPDAVFTYEDRAKVIFSVQSRYFGRLSLYYGKKMSARHYLASALTQHIHAVDKTDGEPDAADHG